MRESRFKVGDKVTYKNRKNLPGGVYLYGGSCQGGFVGEVKEIIKYDERWKAYKLLVTIAGRGTFHMSETEFLEYDEPIEPSINYDIY